VNSRHEPAAPPATCAPIRCQPYSRPRNDDREYGLELLYGENICVTTILAGSWADLSSSLLCLVTPTKVEAAWKEPPGRHPYASQLSEAGILGRDCRVAG
jgi:hypothetical protein